MYARLRALHCIEAEEQREEVCDDHGGARDSEKVRDERVEVDEPDRVRVDHDGLRDHAVDARVDAHARHGAALGDERERLHVRRDERVDARAHDAGELVLLCERLGVLRVRDRRAVLREQCAARGRGRRRQVAGAEPEAEELDGCHWEALGEEGVWRWRGCALPNASVQKK